MQEHHKLHKKWLTQYRKGYLELCIMLMLNNHSGLYGQELIKHFGDLGLTVNEGTLYPLLHRMEKTGWLLSTWHLPTTEGHPKRVYSLNPENKAIITQLLADHSQYAQIIDQLNSSK